MPIRGEFGDSDPNSPQELGSLSPNFCAEPEDVGADVKYLLCGQCSRERRHIVLAIANDRNHAIEIAESAQGCAAAMSALPVVAVAG
jgi:hypothetical protein